MIFKVSFKETKEDPSKVVIKRGRTTTVVLKGVVSLPPFFRDMSEELREWVASRTKIEGYEDLANNTLILYSIGDAKCCEGDKYDAVLGERIAESHAKYYIYKFFYDLCRKWCDYYGKVLYGSSGPVADTTNEGLMGCMKKYEALCIRESHHLGELLKSRENG